jgi:glutathione synthase/RimK-type ligase-like ATP-grasp enzyme
LPDLDVALATCVNLPEPDADLAPLLSALRAVGLTADAVAWDDPAAAPRFAAARVTLLRSTWNYSVQPQAFLAWVERTAAVTSLWNPPATVRWNAHKSYLLDLEARGVAVVPTHLCRQGDTAALVDIARARGWSEVVVKPAVSGGSRATVRVRPDDARDPAGQGEAHLRQLVAREDVLIQPYQPSVEGHGERAIVTVEGVATHAVRKSPRFLGDPESVSAAVPIEADEADLAARALAAAPTPLLYGRVDVARGDDGKPRVMELELVEPSLFFVQSPRALEAYVAAVRRRLALSTRGSMA